MNTQLLRRAEFKSNRPTSKFQARWVPLAPHLVSVDALACGECSIRDGRCLTKAWEESFKSSLESEVEGTLRNHLPTESLFELDNKVIEKSQRLQEVSHSLHEQEKSIDESSSSTLSSTQTLGRKCSKCNTLSITLYRRNGVLVCRNCR